MSRSPWDLGSPVVERDAMPAPRRMVGFPSDGGLVTAGVTGTTVLGLSAVQRCLDILANSVSQLVWGERRGTLDLPPSRLVRQPLDSATRRDWVGYVVRAMALFDIEYLWKVGGRDAEGIPMGLWPLDPNYVQPITYNQPILPFSTPEFYYVGTVRVPRDDLIILRRGPTVGVSDQLGGVLRLARIKFAEVLAADAYASRYWQAGGSPTTVLETDAVLNPTEAQERSDRWAEKRSRGPDYAPVMDMGLKARNWGADPTQVAAVEARIQLVADIGRHFGVGSATLNSPNQSSETYSTTEAEGIHLLRYTVQNYVDAIEDAISGELPGGRTMLMDTLPLTNGTFLARAQAYQLLSGSKAVLDVDEIRDQLGFAPVEKPDDLNPPVEAPANFNPVQGGTG